jgi:hypothetical protein
MGCSALTCDELGAAYGQDWRTTTNNFARGSDQVCGESDAGFNTDATNLCFGGAVEGGATEVDAGAAGAAGVSLLGSAALAVGVAVVVVGAGVGVGVGVSVRGAVSCAPLGASAFTSAAAAAAAGAGAGVAAGCESAMWSCERESAPLECAVTCQRPTVIALRGSASTTV